VHVEGEILESNSKQIYIVQKNLYIFIFIFSRKACSNIERNYKEEEEEEEEKEEEVAEEREWTYVRCNMGSDLSKL
jgi:hypothetical protein